MSDPSHDTPRSPDDDELVQRLLDHLNSEEPATQQSNLGDLHAAHGLAATNSAQQLQTQPNIHHPHAGYAGNQIQQTPTQMNPLNPTNAAGTLPYQQLAPFGAQTQNFGQPSGSGTQGTQQQQRFGPHGQVFVRRVQQPVGSGPIQQQQHLGPPGQVHTGQQPLVNHGQRLMFPELQQPSYTYSTNIPLQQPSTHNAGGSMYPDLPSDPEYSVNDGHELLPIEETPSGNGTATQQQQQAGPSRRPTGPGNRSSARPTAEGVLNGQVYVAPLSNSPLERFPENHPFPSTVVVLKDLADRWYSGCNHFAHYGDESESDTKYSQRLKYPVKIERGRRPQRSEVSTGFSWEHPEPTDTLPAGLSLLELMNNYPNHCWGEGLRLLMAEGVTAEELYNNIPEQARHTVATTRQHNYLQHAYSRELGRMVADEAGVKRQPIKRGQTLINDDDDQGEPGPKKQKISSQTRSTELSAAATGVPPAPPTDDPFGLPLLGQTDIPSDAPTGNPRWVDWHGSFGVQGQPPLGECRYLQQTALSQRAHLLLPAPDDRNSATLRTRFDHERDVWKELERHFLDQVDQSFTDLSADGRVSLLEEAFEQMRARYTREIRANLGLQETGNAATDNDTFVWEKMLLQARGQEQQLAGESFADYDERVDRVVWHELLAWMADAQGIVSDHIEQVRQLGTAPGNFHQGQGEDPAPDDDQNDDQTGGEDPMDLDP